MERMQAVNACTLTNRYVIDIVRTHLKNKKLSIEAWICLHFIELPKKKETLSCLGGNQSFIEYLGLWDLAGWCRLKV